MRVQFQDFDPETFSFHKDPVLVVEEFWTPQEQGHFLDAMKKASWKTLADLPAVARAFPNCGNWSKGDIGQKEREVFLEKISLPCIADYIESFPNIKQRHLNFNYYSYGVGDCLATHDDTDEQYARLDLSPGQSMPPQRRIAAVSYFHHEWSPDWGGELIVYDSRKKKDGQLRLEVTHCLEPKPGSIVFFTVPRYHRVCRVDPLANEHRRMSIAGWFMTEHYS